MRYVFHLVQRRRREALRVEAEGTARAAAAAVWQLVSDAASYPQWGPWSDAGYTRHGDPALDGSGAIRWFRYGRTTTVEKVLTAEAGRRLRYTVIGGVPVRNYLAEVTLSPVTDGTHIRWSARWDRTIGGRIVHRTLSRFYPRMMRCLIEAAERAVPAESGA
jgi:uncharacterized protein YndB with AHSA1/START domain